jgi:hypothetical protein
MESGAVVAVADPIVNPWTGLRSLLGRPLAHKWRVQSFSKNKASASCVAYIDARQVMDRLDEACVQNFIQGWERTHEVIHGNLYCYLTLWIGGKPYTRSDCGTVSQTEGEKGESSDAFKRAAVNFGIGRFLYDMGIQYVPANDKKTSSNYPHVVDHNGERVWDLTDFISRQSPRGKL